MIGEEHLVKDDGWCLDLSGEVPQLALLPEGQATAYIEHEGRWFKVSVEDRGALILTIPRLQTIARAKSEGRKALCRHLARECRAYLHDLEELGGEFP